MRRLLLVAFFVVLFQASTAFASHYPLESVSWLEASEVQQLQTLGIADTEALLTSALDPERRDELAQRSGLSLARIDELSRRVDLLQIPGVGPDLVEALRHAGIQGVAALREAEPSALRERLAEVWGTLGRDQDQLPPVDSLAHWMDAARSVPLALVP